MSEPFNANPSAGRVLIIAGSDCSGGAGLQADLKTVTVLGGYAMTAITAITVQNTLGVSAVHDLPVDLIKAQAHACLEDIGADAIKLGMLSRVPVIEAVASVLDRCPLVPVVADPVMVAKGGASLLQSEAVAALTALILPRAALLTPNAPEAAVLTGLAVETPDQMRAAGARLLAMGARAVLMKGGHVPGDTVTDLLMTPDGETRFDSPRIDSRHTHGTGCTLASACATGLAKGLSLTDAVRAAHAYVQGAIRHAPGLGGGHGPLGHGWVLGDSTV
ncbi:MAG: bifunctional hydroxymethylpyrimidine kinase/phosphomethylpyrimidine kinase [Asticcacaulis sp.]